jgi:5-formyltetrahydrofolate cyclo-ligase
LQFQAAFLRDPKHPMREGGGIMLYGRAKISSEDIDRNGPLPHLTLRTARNDRNHPKSSACILNIEEFKNSNHLKPSPATPTATTTFTIIADTDRQTRRMMLLRAYLLMALLACESLGFPVIYYKSRAERWLLPAKEQKGGKDLDEVAYEKDRLEKDAQAMNAMKEQAEAEFSKLRTPWKWTIRKRIWDLMEEKDIARFPRPVHHRIPNFVGAEQAAQRLAALDEFQRATCIKVNPDTPQRPVRHAVLEQGKTLLTPQPRLRTGFFSTIKMSELPSLVQVEDCTTSKGVAKYGTSVTLNDKYSVDLVVVGSTAVCPQTGARVGKGEGTFYTIFCSVAASTTNRQPTLLLMPNPFLHQPRHHRLCRAGMGNFVIARQSECCHHAGGDNGS